MLLADEDLTDEHLARGVDLEVVDQEDAENCVFAVEHYDCASNCLSDGDGDGVCDTDEIPGCTDDNAVNFDPAATDENGTCQYAGCTDSAAENYSASAIADDGSCEYLCIGIAGCTYPGATNYQANANCEDGSCEFPPFANDLCIFDLDGNGFIGAADLIVFLGVYEMTCDALNAE